VSHSALHAAAQRGSLKLLQQLLAAKAEVGLADSKGWTPLHLSARAGNAPKVQALLEAGAQPAAVNSQGNSPLHLVRGLCCCWYGCGHWRGAYAALQPQTVCSSSGVPLS
jgi:hypothetical protein